MRNGDATREIQASIAIGKTQFSTIQSKGDIISCVATAPPFILSGVAGA